jgi:hypothetical protein
MTSYEPPTIDYFGGARPLQFNPNIYENGLAVVSSISKLAGAFITILGTISTIITTPLFKVIQGATTTIEATELFTRLKSTSFTEIISPSIDLSPLGTWAGVSAAVGYSQLYNPTQVLIFSNFFQVNTPLMEVNPASYGSSNGTINFNTYPADPSVVNSSIYVTGGTATPLSGDIIVSANYTAFKNRYVLFDPAARGSNQIDLNFYTSAANPTQVSAVMSVSGGGAGFFQGTVATTAAAVNTTGTTSIGLSSPTITCSGATTNLNSTTTTLTGTTTNLNSAGTNVSGNMLFSTAADLLVSSSGLNYPLYNNTPQIIARNVAGAGTFTLPNWGTIQYDSVVYFGTLCTGNNTLTLPATFRTGNKCRVLNLGTGLVNIGIAGGKQGIFGNAITRAGAVTFSLGAERYCSITCMDGNGITAIGGVCYFIHT